MSSEDAPCFDLQSHSVHSDGALSPAEVVAAAAAAGVQTLALTDHDATAGVGEARSAAGEHGIALVPAVEITTSHGARNDLHLLGYRIDPDVPELVEALSHSRGDRERRAQRMGDALRELGFALDDDALAARAAAGATIGRPHLAQAVVGHPDNRTRLTQLGLLDATDFLVAYLIEGAPAFSPRESPPIEAAIELVHAAGGLAVWAHPFWDVEDPSETLGLIDAFQTMGVDGVEVFYVAHDEDQTRLLAEHCARRGLLTTGSSDFHGPDHATFSRFRAFHTYGLTPRLGELLD